MFLTLAIIGSWYVQKLRTFYKYPLDGCSNPLDIMNHMSNEFKVLSKQIMLTFVCFG